MNQTYRELLLSETRYWAQKIGVDRELREIHIRPMRKKWASISTRGRLSLSTDLIEQSAEFRRKVIVHELIHLKLRHGKHTKLFHALVRAYLATAAKNRSINT